MSRLILAVSAVVVISSMAFAGPDENFHIYLLIGQSNMAGRGKVDDESKNVNPRVLMLAKDSKWMPAVDPLHFDKPGAGVGPGLAFGKAMADANPQVKIGLVPCAVGGTSIKVWVPGAQDKVTKAFPYDDMLKRMKEAQKTGVLKGIIWHQGEADRGSAEQYGRWLTELIERLRKELDTPGVPFIASELTLFKEESAVSTKKFNEVVQGLSGQVKKYSCVKSDGLGHKGDNLHYSSEAARELGRRYASKMIELQKQP